MYSLQEVQQFCHAIENTEGRIQQGYVVKKPFQIAGNYCHEVQINVYVQSVVNRILTQIRASKEQSGLVEIDVNFFSGMHDNKQIAYLALNILTKEVKLDFEFVVKNGLVPPHLTLVYKNAARFQVPLSKQELARQDTNALNQRLMVAVVSNDLAKVRTITRAGADVHTKDAFGRTPFYCIKSKEMFAELITHGAKPDVQDRYGWTPLHFLVAANYPSPDLEMVKLVLRHDAPLECEDGEGSNVLKHARQLFGNAHPVVLAIQEVYWDRVIYPKMT